jgi:hypothetical protein
MSGKDENDTLNIRDLKWRDEILQVMYWMDGEGFGREASVSDIRKLLDADADVLTQNCERLVADNLLERASGTGYALTAQGKQEGGRRFADEFDEMLKPGHFECDDVDCDCHNPEFAGAACKNLSPAHSTHHHS